MLAHRHFVRAIVRSLLHGLEGEDDIVQQAMLRAWQSGPSQSSRIRPWLAKVARNLTIDHLRASRRRDRGQQHLGAAAEGPSTAEVLQLEEQRQRVVRAVLALPQPYRSTVLMRFWEELNTAEIARRLGEPGATVRSRLKRGLAMLRERLDAAYGARGAWMIALAPLATPGQVIPITSGGHAINAVATISTTGALLMTKSKVVLAAASILLAGLVAWLSMQTAGVPVPSGPNEQASTAMPATGQVVASTSEPSTAAAAMPVATRIATNAAAALTVRGELLNDGLPHPNFAIVLQWFTGLDTTAEPVAEHQLWTDAKGQFVWQGPAVAEIGMVRVVAPASLSTAKFWGATELVQADTTEVVLKLSVLLFSRELHGRVHDPEGVSIAGAKLSINSWPETQVVTDRDGLYRLRVPAAGYPLVVSADAYQHLLLQTYMPDEAQLHERDIELEPGLLFKGRVVDEASNPVAGAKVDSSGLFGGRVETDVDGRFVMGAAKPGSRHRISATKKGFQTGSTAAEAGGEPVEIVLLPGVTVALRVIGPDYEGIVGARVHVVPNAYSGWLARGRTDLTGRRRLEDLAPDPFDVIIRKAGFIRDRRTVNPAKVTGEILITLRPGLAVAGQVLDAAGAAVPGASVYCRVSGSNPLVGEVGTRATSDAAGWFEVTDLPREPCTVFAHHKKYSRAEVEVVGSRTDLVLRMKAAPMVAGRVLNGVTGEAIDDFEVRIASNYEVQSLHMDPLLFENSDGYWQAQHWKMKAGAELFVEVRANGFAPVRMRSAARVDCPRDQNMIRMFAGTNVSGVVRDAVSGAPIPNVLIVLEHGDPKADLHRFFYPMRPLEHRVGERAKTDAKGQFLIESVAAGKSRLRLGHQDYPEAMFGPFQVQRGLDLLEVQPTLSTGVTLRGRVTGMPDAAGQVVSAYCFGTANVATKVQPDLTFSISGLGPGDYQVSVTDPAGRVHAIKTSVADKDIEDLVLMASSGTGSIRGTVVGLESGRVQLRSIDAPTVPSGMRETKPFENYTFLFEGLAPGSYRITAYQPMSIGAMSEGITEVEVHNDEAAATVEYPRK